MDTYQNVVNGLYDNPLSYPSHSKLQCNDITIEQYREIKKVYNAETQRLINKCKDDLFFEFGVKTNPKAEQCWELAWDYGHSSGLSQVCTHFENFVQLILE